MKTAWILSLALLDCWIFASAPTSGDSSAVQLAFTRLQVETTSDGAANHLRAMARSDPSVRDYLSANLPTVIEGQAFGTVWLNAIRLAGDLKIVSAVDALVSALGKNNIGGTVTFAEERHLHNDPPGKALVQIGAPAIPAVTSALSSNNRETRWRAARVLININSPSARAALADHLQDEPDAQLRSFIQSAIGRQVRRGIEK